MKIELLFRRLWKTAKWPINIKLVFKNRVLSERKM